MQPNVIGSESYRSTKRVTTHTPNDIPSARHSTGQHSTAQHSTAQHRAAAAYHGERQRSLPSNAFVDPHATRARTRPQTPSARRGVCHSQQHPTPGGQHTPAPNVLRRRGAAAARQVRAHFQLTGLWGDGHTAQTGANDVSACSACVGGVACAYTCLATHSSMPRPLAVSKL
jgi:hypothetical protein